MSQQSRKSALKLRQLHSTGLCYIQHEKRFIEVPSPWWLWHFAYRQIEPLKLDEYITRIATLCAGYTLIFTDSGPAVFAANVAAPGPSIPSNYWLTLRKLLEFNPHQQYTTLDDIRRLISEEAWPEQRRVLEIRKGWLA